MVRCPECGEIISPNGAVTASAMLGVHRRLEHPAPAPVGTGRNNDRAVRKLTPTHLGRPSSEEQTAMEKSQRIEARDLRDLMLLTGVAPDNMDDAVKAVQWWLRDIEHYYRMTDHLDSQAVVTLMLDMTQTEEG